jgi:hypothetical protein
MVKINHDGGRQVNSRAYLSRFNFGGSDQNKKVSTLVESVIVYTLR